MCAEGNYTRFHMPTNIINEYPVEMNVTSYGSNSTGLQDAPQRKTQSRVKTHAKGRQLEGMHTLHASRHSNPMQAAPLAAPLAATISWTRSLTPIGNRLSRYSRDYACTVLRVETWKSNQIAIFYTHRLSEMWYPPPPWSSCLVSADDTLYYPLWHDNLLHVSDESSGYELREGVLGFTDRKE